MLLNFVNLTGKDVKLSENGKVIVAKGIAEKVTSKGKTKVIRLPESNKGTLFLVNKDVYLESTERFDLVMLETLHEQKNIFPGLTEFIVSLEG